MLAKQEEKSKEEEKSRQINGSSYSSWPKQVIDFIMSLDVFLIVIFIVMIVIYLASIKMWALFSLSSNFSSTTILQLAKDKDEYESRAAREKGKGNLALSLIVDSVAANVN